MLRISDKTALRAAYLTSDRFIHDLKLESYYDRDSRNLLSLAIADYEPYLQRKLRLDDIDAILDIHGLKNMSIDLLNEQYSQILSAIVDEYLQWQGNCFEVKPEKLTSWLELLSVVDSSWIIAQAYKDLVVNYKFKANEIAHCIEQYQCPFALPSNTSSNKFADNHVHLGGHGSLSPTLLSFCLYGELLSKHFKWPKRVEYSLIESGMYPKSSLVVNCALIADKVGYSIFSDEEVNDEQFNFNVITVTRHLSKGNSAQFLMIRSTHIELPSIKRWLLYTTGILLGAQSHNETINLIRLCNILRNYMVVSGVGLEHFVTSYRFGLRHNRSIKQQSSDKDSLEFDIEDNTAREFRVTPNTILSGKNYSIDPNGFAEGLKHLYLRSLAENTHFVLHFTRGGNRIDRLQQTIRNRIAIQVGYLQDFTQSITFSEHDIVEFNSFGTKLNTSIDLRKAIRGYDVAGNENNLPIEIFAPALRVLRESRYPTQGIKYNRVFKPFLTVHAGEDYSHLISGMRSVDEAVIFCNFRNGDRIGHALALGIAPSVWAKKQETAYVTVGEHLDNLVWTYQKALLVVQSDSEMVGGLQILSDKISYWCDYLYHQTYSPKCLYNAWKLRRNCPIKVASFYDAYGKDTTLPKHDPAFKGWIVDFQDDCDTRKAKHVELWMKYLYAQNDSKFLDRREKMVTITCTSTNGNEAFGIDSNLAFDSISSIELKLYEAIQDLCIEVYAEKGIVLEACPTSNIYIGRFEHYYEHPIYRWHPPEESWLDKGGKFNKFGLRNGSVPVCINTDDGALMPTTIRNEYWAIKEAAIHHFGVGVNKAEDWIDRIRKKGVDVFDSNHLEWVN